VEPDPIITPAGLDERDAMAAVLRQPVRHDAAGGSCADHNEVEWFGHGALLPVAESALSSQISAASKMQIG
jgi:hypothetical protein